MELIENYIILENGNILSNGRLLSQDDSYDLILSTKNQNLLKNLSKNKNSAMRCCVAVNPSTPSDVLLKLSQDNNSGVQYLATEILVDPVTTREIFHALTFRNKNA